MAFTVTRTQHAWYIFTTCFKIQHKVSLDRKSILKSFRYKVQQELNPLSIFIYVYIFSLCLFDLFLANLDIWNSRICERVESVCIVNRRNNFSRVCIPNYNKSASTPYVCQKHSASAGDTSVNVQHVRWHCLPYCQSWHGDQGHIRHFPQQTSSTDLRRNQTAAGVYGSETIGEPRSLGLHHCGKVLPQTGLLLFTADIQ